MPTLRQSYIRVPADPAKYGKGAFNSLAKKEFDAFAPAALGLGDVSREGTYVQAIAAIYDLEGFTAFCNQVDSHLVVPEFMKRYLEWFFETMKRQFKEGETADRVTIWGSLPFFVKFLGDGILLLWDSQHSGGLSGIRNTVIRIHALTVEYVKSFLPEIQTHVYNPPKRLRCGVARGQVVSVGEFGDYVGSCINIAARLQRLHGLGFAISRTGLDLSGVPGHQLWKSLSLKRVALRGIGDDQLVYVVDSELQSLRARDRKLFRNVDKST
jgi:class 3 adenylate cyclase